MKFDPFSEKVTFTVFIVIIIGCFIYRNRERLCKNTALRYLYPDETEIFNMDRSDFQFDVFITYAESDRQIMEQMYTDLTSGSRGRTFKCAVHEKDFVPGQSIGENFAKTTL